MIVGKLSEFGYLIDCFALLPVLQNPRQRAQRAQMKQKLPVAASYKMAKAHFESKHPVSLLGELSAKRKLGVPQYELVLQEGPSHQRQFLFKVRIQFSRSTSTNARTSQMLVKLNGFLSDNRYRWRSAANITRRKRRA